MNSSFNQRFDSFKNFDMFGKYPFLYYKGKISKKTWIGRIVSVLFIAIYFSFFIYKLIRMIKKKDVTFYDTFLYTDTPPSIKVTKDNFYGGFALEDPNTYDVFIDESIYFPKAFFKRAERKGTNFEWTVIELELERCTLEHFGSKYKEIFKTKALNNLYCFKEMNFTLEGHFSYDLYSFFYIEFYPCVNSSNNQNCKPLEVIDYYLKNTFVAFQMQDIELTPKNYHSPVRPRDVDLFAIVGKNLFQEIHTYFQIVNVETDIDFIGLNEFSNIKSDIFLKYDEMIIMSNVVETDIYETGDSFCDFTIKLSENTRVERRTYSKLITILGEIGGFLEVVFSIFRIISSFSVDILYEISLVNNLFNFDLDKKMILINNKNKKKDEINICKNNNSPIINSSAYNQILSPQKSLDLNENIMDSKQKMNEESILNNDKLINIIKNTNKKSRYNKKKNI